MHKKILKKIRKKLCPTCKDRLKAKLQKFWVRLKGFTLVELLLVIALVGILSGVVIGVVNVSGLRAKTRDATRVTDLSKIQVALELYYSDNKEFPVTGSLDILSPTYLNDVPVDPSTGNDYCYASDGATYMLAAAMELDGSVEDSPCSSLGSWATFSGTCSFANCFGIESPLAVGSTGGSPPPTCGSANCSGCCDGNICRSGDTTAYCGTGGEACTFCGAGGSCVSGSCVGSGPCADTCPGCCDGENCYPGDTSGQCGLSGAACQDCGSSPCIDGACGCFHSGHCPSSDPCIRGFCNASNMCETEPAPDGTSCDGGAGACISGVCDPCNPYTCSGCCFFETCYPGTGVSNCGSGGGPCMNCRGLLGPGARCVDGVCGY